MVPLSLNGMWMVCAETSAAEAAGAATAPAEVSEHCKKMCPIHAPQDETARMDSAPASNDMQPGAMCVLTSAGGGSSIAAFAFAVTTPAAVVTVADDLTLRDFITESLVSYADPPLSGLTPPPKA